MNISQILKHQIEKVKPSKETLDNINKTSAEFLMDLQKKIKKQKIKADIFVGGSMAKGTLIKKDKYDVDVFVRFDKKYGDEKISALLGKAIGGAKKLHGSRDYYQIEKNKILFEIIPVLKINKPEQALNVTDLSYFHVNYVLKNTKKNKRLADEIMLAKSFTHAQDCYGAEGYIKGFSGYSLELLVIHYKGFINFLKGVSKTNNNNKNEKIIIDDSKFYKGKNVLIELNESKIQSPIILIDPTFKERNALAGLSFETFEKFKRKCMEFLKNPNISFFEKQEIGERLENHKNLIKIQIKTNKQAGDISGTKSKKFFEFFCFILEKEFKIKEKYFEYDEENNVAYFYLFLDKKLDEIIKGPEITKTEHLLGFKKAHKNAFIKNNFAYAKINHNLSFKEFFNIFNKKYKKNMKDMSIREIKLIN